ncbi:ATP-binding cassette domain-containing protein [Streptomyces sp. YIM S03343]
MQHRGLSPATSSPAPAVRPATASRRAAAPPSAVLDQPTIRAVLGLDTPDAGRALVDGVTYRQAEQPLRRVGALLDAGAVHRGRAARVHLAALAATNHIRRSRVEEVLALTGLVDVAHRRIGTYSLGMKQRLGIAAALLGDPPVLIFDEPANGLDPEGIRWIRTLMRSLAAEGRTVLVSSHLMSEMALSVEHLLVIGRGRLLADVPITDFVPVGASLEDAYLNLTESAVEYRTEGTGH